MNSSRDDDLSDLHELMTTLNPQLETGGYKGGSCSNNLAGKQHLKFIPTCHQLESLPFLSPDTAANPVPHGQYECVLKNRLKVVGFTGQDESLSVTSAVRRTIFGTAAAARSQNSLQQTDTVDNNNQTNTFQHNNINNNSNSSKFSSNLQQILQKSNQTLAPFSNSSLGMKLTILGGYVIVQSVDPLIINGDYYASPAQLSPIVPGDILLAINGQMLLGRSFIDMSQLLQQLTLKNNPKNGLRLRFAIGEGTHLLKENTVSGKQMMHQSNKENGMGNNLNSLLVPSELGLVDQLSGISFFNESLVPVSTTNSTNKSSQLHVEEKKEEVMASHFVDEKVSNQKNRTNSIEKLENDTYNAHSVARNRIITTSERVRIGQNTVKAAELALDMVDIDIAEDDDNDSDSDDIDANIREEISGPSSYVTNLLYQELIEWKKQRQYKNFHSHEIPKSDLLESLEEWIEDVEDIDVTERLSIWKSTAEGKRRDAFVASKTMKQRCGLVNYYFLHNILSKPPSHIIDFVRKYGAYLSLEDCLLKCRKNRDVLQELYVVAQRDPVHLEGIRILADKECGEQSARSISKLPLTVCYFRIIGILKNRMFDVLKSAYPRLRPDFVLSSVQESETLDEKYYFEYLTYFLQNEVELDDMYYKQYCDLSKKYQTPWDSLHPPLLAKCKYFILNLFNAKEYSLMMDWMQETLLHPEYRNKRELHLQNYHYVKEIVKKSLDTALAEPDYDPILLQKCFKCMFLVKFALYDFDLESEIMALTPNEDSSVLIFMNLLSKYLPPSEAMSCFKRFEFDNRDGCFKESLRKIMRSTLVTSVSDESMFQNLNSLLQIERARKLDRREKSSEFKTYSNDDVNNGGDTLNDSLRPENDHNDLWSQISNGTVNIAK